MCLPLLFELRLLRYVGTEITHRRYCRIPQSYIDQLNKLHYLVFEAQELGRDQFQSYHTSKHLPEMGQAIQ